MNDQVALSADWHRLAIQWSRDSAEAGLALACGNQFALSRDELFVERRRFVAKADALVRLESQMHLRSVLDLCTLPAREP